MATCEGVSFTASIASAPPNIASRIRAGSASCGRIVSVFPRSSGKNRLVTVRSNESGENNAKFPPRCGESK